MSAKFRQQNREKQRRYRRRVWQGIVEMLGGKCELCGEDEPEKLVFDHKKGRNYELHKLSSTARMTRYLREAQAGLGRLLCERCNLKERRRNDNGAFVPTAADVNGEVPHTDRIPF